ncbi:MAG TPA: hypothetical protein VM869_13620 [Enhygromyxa sp.]|nr:hypothetical protein [Enhygromyxa sp.]
MATLALGCDKTSPDSQPPVEPAPTTETTPEPAVPWGDGSLRGTVKLEWGAAAPDGSTLQLRLWKGGEVVHQHDLPVSGAGPWPFEFTVPDTSSFAADQMFGLGATLVVPPDGEAWYNGNPPTVQVWKQGELQADLEIGVSPINPKAAGDGPPKK